ncbi:hypothetical protein PAPYR_2113 [Paratrimastix pyriformis]|uniref:Uncharacterized protein n=1 Tax=Paratrimastix pyriformis TaxID=342808 RepID=A0ABQ8UVD7_9EUKA|nr:hypothetical protein PAPYR_2113 [Paratrimastix pyriformis]
MPGVATLDCPATAPPAADPRGGTRTSSTTRDPQQGSQLRTLTPGGVGRFLFDTLVEEETAIRGARLVAIPRRGAHPDSWSKIVFHFRARAGRGVTFDALGAIPPPVGAPAATITPTPEPKPEQDGGDPGGGEIEKIECE